MSTATTRVTLERVLELCPEIAQRAAEIEAARTLPNDLVEQLRHAGVFRMNVAAHAGGDELSLREGADVLETLARADGSTGWVAAIGAGWPYVLSYLPDATYRTVYADGPDAILAGVAAPTGEAVRETGGYRLRGQWAFASGCHHADYLVATAFVRDNATANGAPPEIRLALLEPDQCEILDTWYVSGLKGTGSADFRVAGALVEPDRTGRFYGDAVPTVRHPADGVPLLTRICLDHITVALGIAAGAIDDVIGIAPTKALYGAPHPLAADPVFRHGLGRATAELAVLRAAFHSALDELESVIALDGEFTLEMRVRIRSAAAHISERCAAIVDQCYTSCGSSGLRESSPLQRRLRDIRALSQHVSLSPTTFTAAGAFALDEPIDATLL
jgi:alkylation response protein AidB-like acyl-CoA dehydrogenase